MTFREIKQGSTVHILNKDDMTVTSGNVQAVSFPHMGNNGGMAVDVTIETDGKAATYTIPENLSVTYANNIVLATDRQMLSGEVQRMKTEAENALASVEYHKKVIEKADELLAELNPAIREKQETERRFCNIEDSVKDVKGMIKTLLDKLA